MSSAEGYTTLTDVWPTYGFDSPPPLSTTDLGSRFSNPSVTDVTQQIPHSSAVDATHQVSGTSVGHVAGQVPHASLADVSGAVDHLAHGVAHVLHELLHPAAVALGAMSGALLAGRAAMAATGLLAHAAVRAAEDQRCLLRRQEASRDASRQWESAAFAATRVNARRTLLAARLARAARGNPPGSPLPPASPLPPPVQPVACRLDFTREVVAELERAVERAETELAAWECAAAVADAADPRDAAWQRVLADRRRAVLRPAPSVPYTEAAPAAMTPDRGADEDEVATVSAALLAALPAGATAEDTEPVVTALHYALVSARSGDGVGATEHLEEAHLFADETGRRVRLRADALIEAAAQLDFLTTDVPSDVEPVRPDPDVVAMLRTAVEEGRPLGAADRDRARAAVEGRLEPLEQHYLRLHTTRLLSALGAELSEWNQAGGGDVQETDGEPGVRSTRYTPPGWGRDHWIEITVRADAIDLATRRAGPPSPLDAERCAEAKRWAADLEDAVSRIGLDCDFRFDSNTVTQGTPSDGTHEGAGTEQPGRRDRDDRRRPDDGPRHRRLDERDDQP
ncbi:hypothetical protein OHB41_07175 [Streptomyces sp. NBC_01571]|uniref:hypothetical protein n=1 Tax=Streptomyces sp. NBC_01571 TaxID=2975883 RepID=UPI002258A5E6|nr:hypothetical protein [Streptomyces sp. NBC_01571]MCX4572965.1 hypothetical protein [Streptomyces sp. NBC_01571]